MKNEAGVVCTNEEEISDILIDYYQQLFTTASPTRMEEVLRVVPSIITEEQNAMLAAEFVRAEIDEALQQMEPLKALGPDGLPPLFYQKFWNTIGDDVSAAILNCLNSGFIPPSINRTFITLIPKVKSPTVVSEFRPISLCNVIYKLASKVIANRLKKVLPHLISESQSAFQSNKAISDNILVAFELLHHMKTQKSKTADFMTLKLDMSKAYDGVEWRFLIEIMKKMGFCDAWVTLIYECISTVSYSILVNGEPKGEISPTRGIRQGDPLSPYLFLLCSEGLNRMIQQAARDNVIRGFSLCKNGPKITNLFFADDTLLFCRARMEDLQAIQHILSLYEGASGQQINREKTTLFFSKAVPEEKKRDILSFLGVPEIKEYEKYLGLPAVVGRNKRQVSIISKRGCGHSFKFGRKSPYLKRGERSCSRRWCKLFPHLQ